MKQQIKIYFTDFWSNFDINHNFITDFLKIKYDIIIDKFNPDFLFYSCFGSNFVNYNCIRIFYSGENIRTNWDDCDWSFSSDYIDSERHFRLPNYFYLAGDVRQATVPKPPIDEILKQKTKFCNFIYSNPACKKRNDFFHKLSKYKKVDSAGRYLNNVSLKVDNKVEFIKNYKFTIAFENSEFEGYTTEKLFEPFLANSVPIYWGNPLVCRDFNPKSFLNYYDFHSDEELIERIIEIDKNDDLYAQYVGTPAFYDNKPNEFVDLDKILLQCDKIFTCKTTPISHNIYYRPAFTSKILKTKKRFQIKMFWIKYRLINFRIAKISIKLKKLLKKSNG